MTEIRQNFAGEGEEEVVLEGQEEDSQELVHAEGRDEDYGDEEQGEDEQAEEQGEDEQEQLDEEQGEDEQNEEIALEYQEDEDENMVYAEGRDGDYDVEEAEEGNEEEGSEIQEGVEED